MVQEALDAKGQTPKNGDIDWLHGNVINPLLNELVQKPGNVMVDTANFFCGMVTGKDEFKSFDKLPVMEVTGTASVGYWTQAIMSGIGDAFVYGLAGKFGTAFARTAMTKPLGLFSRGEDVSAKTLARVEKLQRYTGDQRFGQVLGSLYFDSVRHTEEGETHFGNALSSVATFGTIGALNRHIAYLPTVPKALGLFGIGDAAFMAGQLAGTVGGNSLHIDGSSLTQAGVMNVFLPYAQRSLMRGVDAVNYTGAREGVPWYSRGNRQVQPDMRVKMVNQGQLDMTQVGEVAPGGSAPTPDKLPAQPEVKTASLNQIRSIGFLERSFRDAGYLAEPRMFEKLGAAVAAEPQGGAFLFGPAGSGKTYLTETFAKATGARYFYKQATPGTTENHVLVDVGPNENTKSGISREPGVLVQATNYLREHPDRTAVLVLDEWDKARPTADSILLDFLQNGRINHGGVDVQMTPDERRRLTVFIAMNDERSLSEPLIRRLHYIHFQQPSVETVHRALVDHAGNHPLIGPLLSVYQRAQISGMSKPVTIQELKQAIDAHDYIVGQGRVPDFNSIVASTITKTPDNHAMLAKVQGERVKAVAAKETVLDPKKFQYVEPSGPQRQVTDAEPPALQILPSLSELRGIKPDITPLPPSAFEDVHGVLHSTARNYNLAVMLARRAGSNPANIGDFARVETGGDQGRVLVLKRPVPLTDSATALEHLWGQPGEVSLVEPGVERRHIMALQGPGPVGKDGWKGLQITSFANDEVIGRAPGISLRWTKQNGAEILVNLEGATAQDNPLSRLKIMETWYKNGLLQPLAPAKTGQRAGIQEISLGTSIPQAVLDVRKQGGLFNKPARVVAKLSLPTDANGDIHPGLLFDVHRPVLNGAPLNAQWGTVDGQYRTMTRVVPVNAGWSKAIDLASNRWRSEMAGVLARIRERDRMLGTDRRD
jgi:MoxR-like ATPase